MQNPAEERRRLSSRQKMDAVLRLLRGEPVEVVGRDLGVSESRVTEWRDIVLRAGQSALKSRAQRGHDTEIEELQALVQELALRIDLLGEGRGPAQRTRLLGRSPRPYRKMKSKGAPH